MLSGEFIFKAKNYNVSNTFFLNLLQITFRNAIAPDYMENYMRQGKKPQNCSATSWQVSPCLDFKRHYLTLEAYKLKIATPTVTHVIHHLREKVYQTCEQ